VCPWPCQVRKAMRTPASYISSSAILHKLLQILRETEARRLEEVGTRLQIKRLIADGEKKEREVKITDWMPPTKRSRGRCASSLASNTSQRLY